jgi:FKBP-type peptidyl-prolyl cis-trans isomerase 2
MKTAQPGSTVTINFSILLDSGKTVGGPGHATPLTFPLGRGKVLKKLEEGILGMATGEKRKLCLVPAEAYGEYNNDLVLKVERTHFTPDIKLSPGRTVQYQNRSGERVNFVVKEVDEKTVIIDGNHPLAGMNLTYEVELVEVK